MPRKPAPIEHGTTRGYDRHLKEPGTYGEPCAECRRANAEAMAEYRERHGRDRSKDTLRATVRRKALNRLAEEYETRFQVLLEDEMRKAQAGASR